MAHEFDALREAKSETILYDSAIVAYYCYDELPRKLLGRCNVVGWFMPLFGYRSQLVMGRPWADWESYWLLAKELFPHWIGFSEQRLNPPPEIRDLLLQGFAEKDARSELRQRNWEAQKRRGVPEAKRRYYEKKFAAKRLHDGLPAQKPPPDEAKPGNKDEGPRQGG